MVNFGVTEAGLEEQLLALVVAHERPDLQEQAANLVRQLASFTITLTELEDDLLQRLASSQACPHWLYDTKHLCTHSAASGCR